MKYRYNMMVFLDLFLILPNDCYGPVLKPGLPDNDVKKSKKFIISIDNTTYSLLFQMKERFQGFENGKCPNVVCLTIGRKWVDILFNLINY